MLYRQKPNGMWLVDYEDTAGKRRRVSTGIKTEPMKREPPEVRAVARDIVLGVRTPKVQDFTNEGKARKRDERLSVSDLLNKCEMTIWSPENVRSQRTIRSNVKLLSEFIGDTAVEDVTYTRLEQLVADMKAKGYKPATIKRKLATLARALKQATMWEDEQGRPLLRFNPPKPTVVVNNLKERTISPEEQEALFAAVEKRRQLEPSRPWFRFRAFLTVVWATGGRLSEVLGLGPDHLTQQGGATYVTFPRYRTKSGKPRTLPLTDDAVEALGGLMDHLVLDQATQEWRFFGLSTTTVDVMHRTIRTDVERETGMDLHDVGIHTIRHTVLTRLARGGMGLAQLQLWAGHSDPKITAERYLHLMPSDLVGGLAILSGTGGTNGATKARNPARPVTVPSSLSRRKGAELGTHQLQ